MSTWIPGKPVITEQDHADWQAWRRERKREQQRDRRSRLRRIDYHASPDIAAALQERWKPVSGHDFSAIINRIIRDWLRHCHRNK